MKLDQLTSPVTYKRASALDTTMEYMGSIMSFLAKGEDTGGRFALMEIQMKSGNEPPPHVHDWEHEMFYILEGRMEVYCEDKILALGPGEIALLPQGQPHAFYIRSPHLRMLILVQATGEHAVGLDRYFIGMGKPTSSMDLPSKAVTHIMDDPKHAIGVAAKNGVHILSPHETAQALPHYPGFGVNG